MNNGTPLLQEQAHRTDALPAWFTDIKLRCISLTPTFLGACVGQHALCVKRRRLKRQNELIVF